jgi:hypothetical protein
MNEWDFTFISRLLSTELFLLSEASILIYLTMKSLKFIRNSHELQQLEDLS